MYTEYFTFMYKIPEQTGVYLDPKLFSTLRTSLHSTPNYYYIINIRLKVLTFLQYSERKISVSTNIPIQNKIFHTWSDFMYTHPQMIRHPPALG